MLPGLHQSSSGPRLHAAASQTDPVAPGKAMSTMWHNDVVALMARLSLLDGRSIKSLADASITQQLALQQGNLAVVGMCRICLNVM